MSKRRVAEDIWQHDVEIHGERIRNACRQLDAARGNIAASTQRYRQFLEGLARAKESGSVADFLASRNK